MGLVQQLGVNVRKLRTARGWSQDALAVKAGMQRSYISDLERGTRNPSVDALGRLAVALEIPPWELLRG